MEDTKVIIAFGVVSALFYFTIGFVIAWICRVPMMWRLFAGVAVPLGFFLYCCWRDMHYSAPRGTFSISAKQIWFAPGFFLLQGFLSK